MDCSVLGEVASWFGRRETADLDETVDGVSGEDIGEFNGGEVTAVV